MTALARLSTVVLDCADPEPLAEFYRKTKGADAENGFST